MNRSSDHLRRSARRAALLLLAVLAGACATAPNGGGGAAGLPDPAEEARLVAATRPAHRLHVLFDWNMTDRDARLSGRGVLRLDGDRRGRVDLFDPRGITLAAAIVDGPAMRVVPLGADALLPPPALLWAALGAFRVPAEAPLTGTSVADDRTLLDYAGDGVRWRFRFEGDMLRHAEWTAPGGRRTVELSGTSGFGLPAETSFRDWTQFRQLTLRVTEVEETRGFEPDVWILPGER
jgi:hypothetical protein